VKINLRHQEIKLRAYWMWLSLCISFPLSFWLPMTRISRRGRAESRHVMKSRSRSPGRLPYLVGWLHFFLFFGKLPWTATSITIIIIITTNVTARLGQAMVARLEGKEFRYVCDQHPV
jgi:hypothetical protein